MPASENVQVLVDDCIEKTGHQFGRGDALLLQAVDVRLGKHAALARNRMDPDAVISLPAQGFHGQVKLGVDLIQHGAGPSRTLIIHAGNFVLFTGSFGCCEHNPTATAEYTANYSAG